MRENETLLVKVKRRALELKELYKDENAIPCIMKTLFDTGSYSAHLTYDVDDMRLTIHIYPHLGMHTVDIEELNEDTLTWLNTELWKYLK